MLTVALKDILFEVPIGLYTQEQLVYNKICIDIEVKQAAVIDDLPFIDYSILFQIVSNAVHQPTQLLETIIQRVHKNILQTYPDIFSLDIQISKQHPPLGGSIGASVVSWQYLNNKL